MISLPIFCLQISSLQFIMSELVTRAGCRNAAIHDDVVSDWSCGHAAPFLLEDDQLTINAPMGMTNV